MKQTKTIQDRFLEFCYTNEITRILLKPFVCKGFSEFMGKLLDSKCSTVIIPIYQRLLKVDMSDVREQEYRSFNDFFTRRLKDDARPFVNENEYFPSPCDGLVTVVPIKEDSRFKIKHTSYSCEELFKCKKLAKEYEGGMAIILRLTVSDYHRYCYSVSGKKSINRRIEGIYHTVNSIANDYVPIYKTNTREYTRIVSPIYGSVIQMEVGALCVGRIVNYEEKANVTSGTEKGKFEFGGSTVVVFVQNDKVEIREDLLLASEKGIETYIKMGQALGKPVGER